MPDVPPWARVAGDVNVGVRRGAWYQVIRLTPEADELHGMLERSLRVGHLPVALRPYYG